MNMSTQNLVASYKTKSSINLKNMASDYLMEAMSLARDGDLSLAKNRLTAAMIIINSLVRQQETELKGMKIVFSGESEELCRQEIKKKYAIDI